MNPKKTICVDLDGVLATYEGWKGFDHIGKPRPGAVEFMRDLRIFARVVIFTTRCNMDVADRPEGMTAEKAADFVASWLRSNGIEFDEVYIGQGKPLAAAFLDDRNVGIPFNPFGDDFSQALTDLQAMLARK